MLKYLKELFSRNVHTENEEFLWAVAEALLWLEEEPSMGALPAPIKEQDNQTQKRLYADAKYLCGFVISKLPKVKKKPNTRWRLTASVDGQKNIWRLEQWEPDCCGGGRYHLKAVFNNEDDAKKAFEHVRYGSEE